MWLSLCWSLAVCSENTVPTPVGSGLLAETCDRKAFRVREAVD